MSIEKNHRMKKMPFYNYKKDFLLRINSEAINLL